MVDDLVVASFLFAVQYGVAVNSRQKGKMITGMATLDIKG